MNYPALLFWVLVPFSAITSARTVLVMLLASIPFAGFTVIPTNLVGGVTILPQSIFAIVLVFKVVTPRLLPLSPELVTACQLRNLGFLALFLLVGTVATLIMPRLFVGDIFIYPLRDASKLDALQPTIGNFTQLGYVALGVMTTFAVTLMADRPGFTQTILTGMLAGGAVCVITGLADFAAASAGLQILLRPFRNAEYAYLAGDAAAGIRRVIGLAPEASAYGAICVQFTATLALLRNLYAEGARRIVATIVLTGLIAMALLSTSSTAYLGLAVLALVYSANWIRRAVFSAAVGQSGLIEELLVGLGLMIALFFIFVVRADFFDPLVAVIQEIIFNKPLSDSFYGRMLWNTVAWNAVASTWGLGIGFGSARTSGWFAAVISGAGVAGALFMGLFLIQTFARRPIWRSKSSAELMAGLKLSLLPVLAMAGVAAPGPDFGPWTGVVFGAIAGIATGAGRVRQVAANKQLVRSASRHSVACRRTFGSFIPSTRRRHAGPELS